MYITCVYIYIHIIYIYIYIHTYGNIMHPASLAASSPRANTSRRATRLRRPGCTPEPSTLGKTCLTSAAQH